jgi:Asp-tRNA(Asn)/Glu-tRNA(Gln) amidotransferase A subunit family amidase
MQFAGHHGADERLLGWATELESVLSGDATGGG